MKFLAKNLNSWTAMKEELSRNISTEELRGDLKRKVNSAQIWLCDLDDNHAPSPAKAMAKRAMGTSYFSPKYLAWAASTGIALAAKGKEAETEMWQKYVDLFLRDREALAEIENFFDQERVKQSLYQGVEEFFRLLPVPRYYVTRNIAEVARAYAAFLEFRGSIAEAVNKEKAVEKIVRESPFIDIYGVDGDSEEDGVMIDVLKHYRKEVVSFQSMNAPDWEKVDRRFDYAVSKDRTSLVDIIKS